MNYNEQINPELRRIAKNIPYNRAIIWCANLFQLIFFRLTTVPGEIAHQSMTLAGYQMLDFKTDLFQPSNITGKLPGLIYVHGGAFSYRASSYHKKLACMYARNANCRVYFPHYHRTPKYPFPAAYEDVLALYRHISEHSEELGINRNAIGIAGDSAGASIAALISNYYKQENLPPPCLQMLVYPVTDGTMQTDSMKKFSDTPLWNAKNNRRMWSYYCKNSPYDASPLHSCLPPIIPDTYIELAEYDCLHDEGMLYGKKLIEAGASVEINETLGTIHGYDSAINTKIAARNIEKRISFLKRKFHSGPPVEPISSSYFITVIE